MKKKTALFLLLIILLAFVLLALWVRTAGGTKERMKSVIPQETEVSGKVINGHRFIDLGLPSGLLWAECNIGASSPCDDGDYFAWGETETKPDYSESTYKWGSEPGKYNNKNGKTVLETGDDAAAENWGKGCRMPSIEDFWELRDKCEWVWSSDYNGAKGYIVKGSNGNAIFLPASGLRSGVELCEKGSNGYYWSGTIHTIYPTYAFALYIDSGYRGSNFYDRYCGYTVRPVAKP